MPDLDTLEAVGPDLDDARAKIEETREALLATGQDTAELRAVLVRLERMAAELQRIEERVAGQAVTAD